jgi:hypothetical protein
MRFTQEQLTFKALLVVQEAVHQCSSRPINLSLGLRFALAYLYATSKSKNADQFKHFAACIADPYASQTEYLGNYLRAQQARGFLCSFMEGACVSPSIDSQSILRTAFEQLTNQPKANPPSRNRD